MKMMKKVLSHEITHAAMFSYNIDLSIDAKESKFADILEQLGGDT